MVNAKKLRKTIEWERIQQPIPVFLPGKSHGERSLAGYCPGGHKELDKTERLTFSLCYYTAVLKLKAKEKRKDIPI